MGKDDVAGDEGTGSIEEVVAQYMLARCALRMGARLIEIWSPAAARTVRMAGRELFWQRRQQIAVQDTSLRAQRRLEVECKWWIQLDKFVERHKN
jgi:hypothetical protein